MPTKRTPKINFRFPQTFLPRLFIPSHGGHSQNDPATGLCVMEALHFSLFPQSHLASTHCLCVHLSLENMFIGFNDNPSLSAEAISFLNKRYRNSHGLNSKVRRYLAENVHRILGTSVLTAAEINQASATSKLASTNPFARNIQNLDAFLTLIDALVAKKSPYLARLRSETLPLFKRPIRRSFKLSGTRLHRSAAPDTCTRAEVTTR